MAAVVCESGTKETAAARVVSVITIITGWDVLTDILEESIIIQ